MSFVFGLALIRVIRGENDLFSATLGGDFFAANRANAMRKNGSTRSPTADLRVAAKRLIRVHPLFNVFVFGFAAKMVFA
jgi:hypothetical protein